MDPGRVGQAARRGRGWVHIDRSLVIDAGAEARSSGHGGLARPRDRLARQGHRGRSRRTPWTRKKSEIRQHYLQRVYTFDVRAALRAPESLSDLPVTIVLSTDVVKLHPTWKLDV